MPCCTPRTGKPTSPPGSSRFSTTPPCPTGTRWRCSTNCTTWWTAGRCGCIRHSGPSVLRSDRPRAGITFATSRRPLPSLLRGEGAGGRVTTSATSPTSKATSTACSTPTTCISTRRLPWPCSGRSWSWPYSATSPRPRWLRYLIRSSRLERTAGAAQAGRRRAARRGLARRGPLAAGQRLLPARHQPLEGPQPQIRLAGLPRLCGHRRRSS